MINNNLNNNFIIRYGSNYSEIKLFSKIKSLAKKAGVKIIYLVFILFTVLKSKKVTISDKRIIVGALGYFILPFDIIPDFVPGGFIDDLTIIIFAFNKIKANVDEEIEEAAKKSVIKIFGQVNEDDFKF